MPDELARILEAINAYRKALGLALRERMPGDTIEILTEEFNKLQAHSNLMWQTSAGPQYPWMSPARQGQYQSPFGKSIPITIPPSRAPAPGEYVPPGVTPMVSPPAAGEVPAEQPEAEADATKAERWYVPGSVLFNPTTGVYSDPVYGNPIEKADAERMYTEYQKKFTADDRERQLEREEWQRAFEQLQMQSTEWQRLAQSREQARGMYSAFRGAGEPDMGGSEEGFEAGRQQALAGLQDPYSWIQKWQMEKAVNPYTKPPLSWTGIAQQAHQNYKDALALSASAAEKYPGIYTGAEKPTDTGSQLADIASKSVLSTWKAWQAAEKGAAEERAGSDITPQAEREQRAVTAAQYGEEAGAYSPGGGIKEGAASVIRPQPTTAPAPAWLGRFVPGQAAGQPITRGGQVMTPTLSSWSQTPVSQREGLRGYLDWSGGRQLEDILMQMYSMLPKQPAGAGRTSWSPVRVR